MEEIAQLVPEYGGIRFDRLEKAGLQWPCPDLKHEGTRFLHEGQFTRGRGLFIVPAYTPPFEKPDERISVLAQYGKDVCPLSHGHDDAAVRISQQGDGRAIRRDAPRRRNESRHQRGRQDQDNEQAGEHRHCCENYEEGCQRLCFCALPLYGSACQHPDEPRSRPRLQDTGVQGMRCEDRKGTE